MAVRCAAIAAILSLAGAAAPLQRHEATRVSMGCVYAIVTYGRDAAALARITEDAFDEVDRIDRLMSHYRPESPLSRVNREAAQHPVGVDPELFDFIAEALRYSRESDGAFDVTVGPLMKAWGFFRGEGRMPSDGELAAARRGVGAAHVRLNPADHTIAFDRPGVELDLGGIAKGYAVDRAVALLKRRGVTAALVSAGGSTIYGLGAPPGRDAWDVEIQDPLDSRRIARTVTLRDRALSVAGRSEKSFESGGVTYSHIMDPRTGRPVQGMLSVAVLAPTGTAADALDNALFVLGRERSQPYLRALPPTEAIFFPAVTDTAAQRPVPDLEAAPFAPRSYVAYRPASPVKVDGKLDEAAWASAPWTDAFVDIEGDARPRPRFRTRAKMLWDDAFFYVAADLDEPDVWATLTERDSIIFRDNDFEIFIDPDGDTHAYAELEVNALGTPWDLLLIKPYRDGGPAIHAWDIAGLQVGVDVRGTINRPGDRDDGWSVEIAMPWSILRELAPGHAAPKAGDRWRVNFSRVEWQVDATTRYAKRLRPGTADPLPEDNWVWSPQGAIDMHMPERWGVVQFSGLRAGSGAEPVVDDPNERVAWALRRLYYRQRKLRASTGSYARSLDALGAGDIRVDGLDFRPELDATASFYEIAARGFAGVVVHINQDGRVWRTASRP
ncbi:MAG TPA: FAD:protein FMN transferase [Vicinamibacterales bacterium]|nr:FAD:protein FMN transferase [Vicinamibacterales bacterium]